MIAVLFEVEMRPGMEDQYIELARQLSESLQGFDGFLGVERFRSLANESKLLSLSYWTNEEAVSRWRNLDQHRAAQMQGRAEIVSNYTLRIADVQRSYGMNDRTEAPTDSRSVHG